MWGSLDESDIPVKASSSGKPQAGKPTYSLTKKAVSTDLKSQVPAKPSPTKKQPSRDFVWNSTDSSDSDSSNGNDDKKAHFPSNTRATPTSKPPTPKPRATSSGTKSGVSKQPVTSAKEPKPPLFTRKEPDVRPKTFTSANSKRTTGGNSDALAGRATRKSGTTSSEEDLSLRRYVRPSNVPESRDTAAGKGRPFERLHVKPWDTDRGQQYSRREEKLNLTDFLPDKLQGKLKKNQRSLADYLKRRMQTDGAFAVGGAELRERLDESRFGTDALKSDDSAQKGSDASYRPLHARFNQLSLSGNAGATASGIHSTSRKSRSKRAQDNDDLSSTDDESLEMLLSAAHLYVPPHRKPAGDGQKLKLGISDDFPALGDRGKLTTGPERRRRPDGDTGVWARGQKPPDNKDTGLAGRHFGRRENNERDMDRNWRERDKNDRGDVNNRRGNWDDRHPHPRDEGRPNGGEDRRRHVPPPRPDHAGDEEEQRRRGGGDDRQRYAPPPRPDNVEDEKAPRGQGRQHQGQDRGAGNRRHNRPQPEGLRHLEANLPFGRLRELKTKNPAEVVAALSYSKEGLSRLLKNEQKLTTDGEMMRLLLGCLGKVCQCQSMPSQQNEIFNLVRTSKFLHCLGTFLTTSSMTAQVKESTNIIGESADLLRTLVTLFPSHIHDVLMVHAFLELAQKQAKLRGGEELPADIVKKVEDLKIAKDAAVEGMQCKQAKMRGGIVDEDSLTPPDDFRQISVFPTMQDLEKEELPFLRKNKAVGGYTSVDHYLDVQFRLLREDFVYPLREGIAEYKDMLAAPKRGRKLKDIRVYHDVRILRAVCLNSGLGHRLKFDNSRGLKRVRWEISKRLIYGSLVCLSADNFRTLYFATVSNREPSDLKEGVVDVTFEHNLEQISAIPAETVFTMAETTAFFEAYRHVLAGLQRIRANELPFEKYIVRCDKHVTDPRYLTNADTKYDLRPLVDDTVMLREDRQLTDQGRNVAYYFSSESKPAESIPVLQREEWPDPKLLKVDNSQYEAMHRALTKEFSVIQGPPGTGKTYVGLKIVKGLLHNRKAWDPDLNSCMLIVCFTNHALDQFLEGVVSFFNGRVVRVGNRLRSEKLEQYSLSNLRWNMRRLPRDDVDRDFKEITRLRFQGHDAMERLKKEVDSMGSKIESAKREILHEEVLMPYMLDKHYDRLEDARAFLEMQAHGQFVNQGKNKKKVFCIPEWLGLGAVLQNTHVTAEDLQMLDQGLGEDDLEIEGEIQALEDQHKLDVDDVGDKNDRKHKEKVKKREQARERKSYLAVDISCLDQGRDQQEQEGRGGGGFQIPRQQWRRLKQKLRRNVESDDIMTEAEERQVMDLWNLEYPQRWRLYRRWAHKLCQSLQGDLREKERLYDDYARRQHETLMQEDKQVLKTATVIAMTTTAAARYQTVLQEVKPRVIVVEEAAEVLEGHVITTLSQDCQHLILIGDHKQLRPNPTVYALARKYNLELSLFERMINNKLRCYTLRCQHRMRPEIATLVKPIYPDLENHSSVEAYEPIKGVASNLFFIDHSEPETHDDETMSHSNLYEAVYLSQFCAYLLKQGYDPSRITVLTTYSGQLFQLKKLMPKKSIFDGVRVTVVDNFQGEENDIILLSLVRSNEDGNIGFLKIENRVCVALSRAKMGLYVIGNFDLLSAESNLWQTITTGLRKEGKIGEALHLYCQNHPNDDGLVIRTPEDFNKAPEGGCMKPCTARLDCGHVCMRMCHPYDKEHQEYKCTKKCERKMACEFEHPCKKLCHQTCGECEEMVQKRMPKCGHKQYVKCSVEPEDFVCQEECTAVLLCGHNCGDVCGERHRCYETILHTWPCGHEGEVMCADRETTPCPHPCGQQLACGHRCAGTCSECHSGRLHRRCKNKCTNILVCAHACRDRCSNCPPCDRVCENSCVHSSCRKRCGLLCAPCKEDCAWQCPHHSCNKLCSEPCDRPQCDEPCPNLLPCNHPCIGLCGEPCPILCRFCDAEKVTEIFFGTEDDPDARFIQLEDCEHVVEVSALDQWMRTTTDTNENSVQLKACPFCKTTIRRNLRYGAIIKTQLNDIEIIKDRMLGDKRKREDALVDLELMVEDETDPGYEDKKKDVFETGDRQTLGGLVAMVNQMKLLEETKKLRLMSKKKSVISHTFTAALEKFEKWICNPRLVFSDQEASDAETELLRLKHWLALLCYQSLAETRDVKLPARVADPLSNMRKRMKEGLPYTESHQNTTKELLKKLEELVPESGLGVSDQERVMILKAMQLNKGHWFKCPKGHIYAIGDCGGATTESRCPECSSAIGGTSYRLREGNTLATEMDGAAHAAWSEQTNLENFRIDDLL